MSFLKGLTYDTQTGRKYKLQDLFKIDSNYKERLSSIISEQLKEREITLLDPPFKSIRPDQDFYLADKSLVIYFQLYEIAAYAYGFLYFPISIYDLQDIIDPDGPLPRLYG
ncbi:RsiV family protein [Bacillus sp. OVS6]|nr:RsiV family protein [Bacillus sp. OVS6]